MNIYGIKLSYAQKNNEKIYANIQTCRLMYAFTYTYIRNMYM